MSEVGFTPESIQENVVSASKERRLPPGKTVLIFGQGPVIHPETREKASEGRAQAGTEDINIWSQDFVEAAKVLRKTGEAQNFVVMGGKTGGEEYSSEAELIGKKIKEGADGVPEANILEENASLDTIENLVNFLNLVEKQGEPVDQMQFSVLTAPYHATRVKVLMKLFAIPVDNVFSATEVRRYNARVGEQQGQVTIDEEKWNNVTLQDLASKEDPTGRTYTQAGQKVTGTEAKSYRERYVDDVWLTRELLEYPQKWLPYIGKIQNDTRVTEILRTVEMLYPGMLESSYHIAVGESLQVKKEKLLALPPYPGLTKETVAQWKEQSSSGEWGGWPPEVAERFNKLMGKTEK